MNATLRQSELLEGLDEGFCERVLAISQSQHLGGGEYLFLLGDTASRLYVVLEGSIDICFPFSLGGKIRDIAVESKSPGGVLGWSAFVKPHRFTLSARAAEPSVVAGFARHDLEQLIQEDCRLGLALTNRLTEIVGARLLMMQALWARELQRSLPTAALGPSTGMPGAPGR